MTYSESLKILRDKLELSQGKLGAMIGVSQKMISFIENGNKRLSKEKKILVDELLVSNNMPIPSTTRIESKRMNTQHEVELKIESPVPNEIDMMGNVSISLKELIELHKSVAVAESEKAMLQHQNELMIDSFSDTLKSINNFLGKASGGDKERGKHGTVLGSKKERYHETPRG